MFHPIQPNTGNTDMPSLFTCPFHYEPHALSIRAAHEVQRYLTSRMDWKEELERGKMFGVLIVERDGEVGFLAAYSGILAGRNDHEYFVPPVYNLLQPEGTFKKEETEISNLNKRIEQIRHGEARQRLQNELQTTELEADRQLQQAKTDLRKAKTERDLLRKTPAGTTLEAQLIRESQFQKAEYKRLEREWKNRIESIRLQLAAIDAEIESLKTERKTRSAHLQQWMFRQFVLLNARGEKKDVWQLFKDSGRSEPPAGTGECAAPKLLQYAYQHHLHPIAMAEFWWGESPLSEIRKHGQFYPSCKSKCEPLLTFMLQGLNVEPNTHEASRQERHEPSLLYEDAWMIAVNKPTGMLSVPGKDEHAQSVLEWAQARFPEGVFIVHRLDMDTSGVLLLAKSPETHKQLQQLFENRNIQKKYIAWLEGTLSEKEGFIRLPLCPNPDDRPRQMVSFTYGKPTVTRYEVLSEENNRTRVSFYPLTGRTHQLRVHAAHPEGLNCPIVGDNLYGTRAERLYLHAASLSFRHPITGKNIRIEAPIPF